MGKPEGEMVLDEKGLEAAALSGLKESGVMAISPSLIKCRIEAIKPVIEAYLSATRAATDDALGSFCGRAQDDMVERMIELIKACCTYEDDEADGKTYYKFTNAAIEHLAKAAIQAI